MVRSTQAKVQLADYLCTQIVWMADKWCRWLVIGCLADVFAALLLVNGTWELDQTCTER